MRWPSPRRTSRRLRSATAATIRRSAGPVPPLFTTPLRRAGARAATTAPRRGQTDGPRSDDGAVRQLPRQWLRQVRAGDDEPRGDDRSGVGGQLRDLPQRNVSGSERADQARDAHRDQRAVRHLSQFDDDLGDGDVQPRGGDAGGGRAVRELPQRHAGAGQADEPHSDDGAVRHLPHGLRRVRPVDDEPRGDHGSGFGRELRDLPQRQLRLRQRAGQARDARRHHCAVRHLPHLDNDMGGRDVQPRDGDADGDRPMCELPRRQPGAGQADGPHSDDGAVRQLPRQWLRQVRAGDDEPRGDDRSGVCGQLRDLPQRDLRGAERADQARDARRHHRAVRHLPQLDDDLGDGYVQPRERDAGGGRAVRDLPQRHAGAGQADQPHSDDGTVRHLPHGVRRVRAGDDEPRGDDGSGVGGQLRDLPQRQLRLRQRAGQARDARRHHCAVRHLPHLDNDMGGRDVQPRDGDADGDRPMCELPRRQPGAGQTDGAHSDDGAVRHLPQELRGLRPVDHEPRGDERSGVGGQLRDLPQRNVPGSERSDQARDAHCDH